MMAEDHTMGEASQTPAKRARIDTSGATAKRPRDEATADTLAPAAAAMASALNDLKTQAPALFALVREFEAELTPDAGAAAYESERAYLKHVELGVYLRALRITVASSLHDSNCRVDKAAGGDTPHGRATGWEATIGEDRVGLGRRTALLDALMDVVRGWRRARVAASEPKPRLWRLARAYGLDEGATADRIFTTLVVLTCAQSDGVRGALIEDDHARRANLVCRVAGCSEVEAEAFADSDHDYVKENVIYVSDDQDAYVSPGGIPPLRVARVTAKVLLGDELPEEELLKTSGTKLETILKDEGLEVSVLDTPSSPRSARRARAFSEAAGDGAGAAGPIAGALRALLDGKPDDPDQSPDEEHKSPGGSEAAPGSPRSGGGDGYPEDNELEYLGECFELVALHIRLATAKIKGAIKEQSGGAGRGGFFPPPDEGNRAGARELKAKLRVAEAKLGARCAKTPRRPRLLQLAKKLGLDEWETKVVALLVGRTISPAIKSLMDGMEASAVQRLDDSTTVGALLSIFCPDSFRDQVEHRTRFYKSSRLISRGVLRVQRSRWHSSGSADLSEQRVELDRRVLDFVVGLDTEINELVEGSELYSPKVDLDDVVLPEKDKATLLDLCEAFGSLGAYSRKTGLFENALPYGSGFIVLLCGPSGTGKTMTVHGVANRLGKRVLQVDFASLRGKHSQGGGDDVDADLRGLFREAEMSDAVLFFDECEALFRSRELSGGDRLLRAMLQEIEKHSGLVFLATNRPAELDEAMHRRISTVLEYAPPGTAQRREIWRTLRDKGKVRSDPAIDWDAIALKYELSGGFIKNALLSALLFALKRDTEAPVLREADVRAGCGLQQRGVMHKHHGALGLREKDGAKTKGRLADVVLKKDARRDLDALVDFEASRGVVFGTWGFDALRGGCASVALLYGPRGGGKRTVAAALAETLRGKLYRADARDVLGECGAKLKAVLDDARLSDSILLLDGFEHAFAANAASAGDGLVELAAPLSKALDALGAYPGVVLLVAHVEDLSTLRFAPSFARRLALALPFSTPDAKLRAKLWRAVLPPACPLAGDVDFSRLGAKHELLPASIRRAALLAAAAAAKRGAAEIGHADLHGAAEREVTRLRGDGANFDRLFV